MTQNSSSVPEPRNRKLNTIAALAFTALGLGLLLLVIGVGDPQLMTAGIAFLGAGISLWVIWLAIGAIVDALSAARV